MKKIINIIGVSVLFLILTSGIVDLNSLFNYTDQGTPNYIFKNNMPTTNPITDERATLGRVLFYDKKLSIDNTVSCATCHKQEFAFGDLDVASQGVNGTTGRHSMRLINARYSDEEHAFWDERASTFEEQATMPIQDHIEMGFSGSDGDPGFDSLIIKLQDIEYYNILFEFVYGDTIISEGRMQKALAQFVRSIESYDSRFDEGITQVTNIESPFPNFTDQENNGKKLFLDHPPLGGAGCARCHTGSEFSMISNSNNNGVIGVIGNSDTTDLFVTKAPTLRDLVNPEGVVNGPMMHNGSLLTLMDVINHYNELKEVPENTNLDFRLKGQMHHLNLSQTQKDALEAFLLTLTGVDVYTNEKWSNPFDEDGSITIVPEATTAIHNLSNSIKVSIYPNPVIDFVTFDLVSGFYQLSVHNTTGVRIKSSLINGSHILDLSGLENGVYIVRIIDLYSRNMVSKKIIKNE